MILNQLLIEIEQSSENTDALQKELKAIIKLESKREENLAKIKTYLKKLDKLLTLADEGSALRSKAIQVLEDYKADLDKTEAANKQRFGLELSDAIKPLGLHLKGHWPTLMAGLFTIKLNSDKAQAVLWYGNEQEKLDSHPIDAMKVAQSIENALNNLGAGLDEENFMSKLKQAYRRAKNTEHTLVPINQVLPELAYLVQGEHFYQDPVKKNYRSYSRADFSYDLFKFGRGNHSEGLQLKVAVRQYTQKRQDFLWIPNNNQGEGTAYSHLQFKD